MTASTNGTGITLHDPQALPSRPEDPTKMRLSQLNSREPDWWRPAVAAAAVAVAAAAAAALAFHAQSSDLGLKIAVLRLSSEPVIVDSTLQVATSTHSTATGRTTSTADPADAATTSYVLPATCWQY